MREPPTDVPDAEVLRLVRTHWSGDVDRVEHLPVGFGAHHWRASAGHRPLFFVTLDRLGSRHSAASLEAAYAGAAALAFALDVVVAGLASDQGTWTVPVDGGRALSLTPWVHGGVAGDGSMTPEQAVTTARILLRLHRAHPPAGLPAWSPLVGRDLADSLAHDLSPDWTTGPLAAPAQAALRAHLPDVRRWVERYHHLAGSARAGRDGWVATHGEPHTRNQLVTPVRTLLVDWESLRLAPPERDLTTLVDAGHGDLPAAAGADPAMLELFDLEWRLDEVAQYTAWFAAEHTGSADDEIALAGLRHELTRAPRSGQQLGTAGSTYGVPESEPDV